MKRKIFVCVITLIVIISAIVLARQKVPPTNTEAYLEIQRQKTSVFISRSSTLQNKTLGGYYIVIDPGHGDNDAGAMREVKREDKSKITISESALTLDISRRLIWHLKRHGVTGVYPTLGPEQKITSETEDEYTYWHRLSPPPILKELVTLLPASYLARTALEAILSSRTEVANQKVRTYGKKRVLFISIHVDSTSPSIRGMRAYSYYDVRSLLAESVARVAKQKGVARTKKIGIIEIPFFSTMHAGFVVINPYLNNACEKILIETTNIRNDADFKQLCTAEGRERIAQTIAEGIALYCTSQKQK